MKTTKNKRSDLVFLRRFANKGVNSQNRHQPLLDPQHFAISSPKLELRWRLTEKYSSPWTETWILGPFTQESTTHFGIPIKYNYQRISFEISSNNPEKFIYPRLSWPKTIKARGRFTSSGQVALCSTFAALSKYYKKRLRIFSDTYWETLDFLVSSGWKIDEKSDIALIDSSLLEGSVDAVLKKCSGIKVLVVDTTCWVHNDKRITKVIQFCLRKRIKLFLCRSHLKLDSLGMEYGRLGSIVWSHVKAETARDEELNQKLQDTLRLWGGLAQVSQLYPFWMNKKFHRENEKWISSLRAANSAFADAIKKEKFQNFNFRKFDHSVFSWIECRHHSVETLDDEIEKLIKGLRFSRFEAQAVASYPWDFIAITYFQPKFHFAKGRRPSSAIRVSLPAMSTDDALRVAEIFKRWMKHADSFSSAN